MNKTVVSQRWSYGWLAVGAVLLFFSNGRWVIPIAAWVFPIFFLRFLYSEKLARGWLIGGLVNVLVTVAAWRGLIPVQSLWLYLAITIGMGLALFLPFVIHRMIAPRIPGFAATLVFPLVWVVMQYLNSLISPYGTWGELAYTQFGNLPLIQMVSVTGIWGLSFLITWFASLMHWIWEQEFAWSNIKLGVGVYSSILVLALLFGGARLALFAPGANTVRVASLTIPPETAARLATIDYSDFAAVVEATAGLPESYLERSRAAAQSGAKIVFWYEGAAMVSEANEADFIAKGRNLAQQEGIYLGMSLEIRPPDFPRHLIENKLVWIDPAGNVVLEYFKSIPVPGEPIVRGDGKITVLDTPYGNLASVICFDMDFPTFIRQAGQGEADLMIAPSNDWKEIDPLHTHMAAFRALENGFSLVRATGRGLSMAVDYQGRVRAQQDYFTTGPEAMFADLPVQGTRTVYSRVGDLFAWLCMLGLVMLVFSVIKRSLTERRQKERADKGEIL